MSVAGLLNDVLTHQSFSTFDLADTGRPINTTLDPGTVSPCRLQQGAPKAIREGDGRFATATAVAYFMPGRLAVLNAEDGDTFFHVVRGELYRYLGNSPDSSGAYDKAILEREDHEL